MERDGAAHLGTEGGGMGGCCPDGALSTCVAYLDFLIVSSGTASLQVTEAFLKTVHSPGLLEGTRICPIGPQEQVSNWK
jgi:hypothetical protein